MILPRRHFFLFFLSAALILSCEAAADRQAISSRQPGITDGEILVGSSLALGGHAGYLGTQIHHGALALIHKVNEQGGIHGRKLRLIANDDG